MNKTPKKRPVKPFRGAEDGKPFTTENQPDPELKKKGWEKWRKDRHLTQTVIKHLGNEKSLTAYVKKLIALAEKGNPKAIDAINKCLEDDIIKVANTDTQGNDIKNLSDEELQNKIEKIEKALAK